MHSLSYSKNVRMFYYRTDIINLNLIHTSMLICCVYLSRFLDLMMLMLQLLLGIISGI